MASLKEIKSRIQSVRSTQKITSAMKMVSSAKLQKAERRIYHLHLYQQKMSEIQQAIFSGVEEDFKSTLTTQREVKKVAIIAFSSNSSLCGSFNSNVIRQLNKTVEDYKHLGKENITIIPIGKKIAEATKKLGFAVDQNFDALADSPNFAEVQKIANELIQSYLENKVDKVELIYHKFVSKGSQVLTNKALLPLVNTGENIDNDSANKFDDNNLIILEPSLDELIKEMLPKLVRLNLYTSLLDSSASEHAARTIAMQTATDNADELLDDLKLQYNKSRQQAITNELLDIIGGSFGQN